MRKLIAGLSVVFCLACGLIVWFFFHDPHSLFEYIERGDVSSVQRKLTHGARVNQKSFGYQGYYEFPLHAAVRTGNVDTVRELLRAGANASAQNASGETPLMKAASSDYDAIAKMLIAAGANVNERSENTIAKTALHQACAASSTTTAVVLLDSGASIDARTDNGPTPLAEAILARRPSLALIQELILRGADLNVTTGMRRLSLSELARQRGDAVGIEIVNFLNARTTK